MRRIAHAIAFLVCFVAVAPTFAQSPNYDVGPVWRVTYYHLKPGMSDNFWKDFREHFKPVYDEAKKQGILSDYKAFYNPVSERPDDWDVAIAILYPNWGALDQVDAKLAGIAVKHYGSREAAFEAARKRTEIRDLVASHLAREVMPK
ncbi:MAG TPA: hypothetical protein VF783_15555 [Terriglobales bacterium]